jgi:uncharacterized RDD family membrane protein YckC
MIAMAPAAVPSAWPPGRQDDADVLVTGEAVGLSVRPAGVIARAAGTIIDWLVYGGFTAGLALAVRTLSGGLDAALVRALSVGAVAVGLVLAPITVETLTRGRSAGRAVMGLRIVRVDGGAASPRHAFIRALVGVVELYATFGSIAMLVALLDPRSRRVGDFLAGTYSQQERVPRPPLRQHRIPQPLAAWAASADVARLPDRLSRRIAAFLAQEAELTAVSRRSLAQDLLAEASPYVWPLPDAPAEAVLEAIAALRHARDARRLKTQAANLARLAPQLEGIPHRRPSPGRRGGGQYR